jgi:hypothetical protein
MIARLVESAYYGTSVCTPPAKKPQPQATTSSRPTATATLTPDLILLSWCCQTKFRARTPRWESGTGERPRPRQIGDGDRDGGASAILAKSGTERPRPRRANRGPGPGPGPGHGVRALLPVTVARGHCLGPAGPLQ